MDLYCTPCVSEWVEQKEKGGNSELPLADFCNIAVTEVPVWQQKMVGDMMLFACITVPSCERHIKKQSKLET